MSASALTTAFSGLAGAVESGGVIMHFGDPMREQRRLVSGSAIAPLGDRTVIEVAGEDRLSWLDSITSQSVARLTPGDSTELLVLDPQGRVEHAAGVLEDGASVWLIADAADAEPLAAWLGRMVFRSRVTVTLRPELGLLGFFAGGDAETALREIALAPNGLPLLWRDPWTTVQAGGHQYANVASHPAAEYDWHVAIVDGDAAASVAVPVTTADRRVRRLRTAHELLERRHARRRVPDRQRRLDPGRAGAPRTLVERQEE